MKELSIEEKAKAYDEALGRASKLRVQNPFDTVSQMMEYVFPELQESEDEKIRKWLIGYFHQYKEDGVEKYANGLKVDSIIAWLEKQGKKPTLRERYKNIGKSEWFKKTHEGMSVSEEEPNLMEE
jgi:hypothetical protein